MASAMLDQITAGLHAQPIWQIAMRQARFLGLPREKVVDVALCLSAAGKHFTATGNHPMADFEALPTYANYLRQSQPEPRAEMVLCQDCGGTGDEGACMWCSGTGEVPA
jgi:hypothetical protein